MQKNDTHTHIKSYDEKLIQNTFLTLLYYFTSKTKMNERLRQRGRKQAKLKKKTEKKRIIFVSTCHKEAHKPIMFQVIHRNIVEVIDSSHFTTLTHTSCM